MNIEQGVATALEIKFAEDEADAGVFSGYGSTFGNVDNGRDMVMPGAFADSIAAKGAKGVKLLWQHDPAQPIGILTEIGEDKRGLKVKGRIITSLTKGREVYEMMKASMIDGLSIGFRTMSDAFESDKAGNRFRKIIKADLWELSIVTFPMNPKATVTGVKSMPSDREIEAMLRDEAKLSNRDAKAAVSVLKTLLRDEGVRPTPARDAQGKALTSELDRLLETLRS